MAALFVWCPSAVANTMKVAEKCAEDGILPLDEDVTPRYPLAEGVSAGAHLREMVYAGALRRRGEMTLQGKERLDEELAKGGERGEGGKTARRRGSLRGWRQRDIGSSGRYATEGDKRTKRS